MKYKVALIRLGHTQHLVDFQFIKKWKSKLFSITTVQCIEHLPDSDIADGYLDVKYSREKLQSLVSCPQDCDYAVAIMPYRFTDNFYMHRINANCVVISLYGIPEILKVNNIAAEHFIIKQLYEICAIKYLMSDISSDDVYNFVHLDTRGCLFDMNGERGDILYNTEQPIICEECKGKFKSRQVELEVISQFEKELKRIKKPTILLIEKWIKKYPLFAILLSALGAIFLNIIANLICKLL